MKILTINVLYPPLIGGGAEIIMQHLCKELKKRGHEINVLTFSDKKRTEEYIEGVKVYRERIPNIYLPYFHNKQKPSFIKRRLWHLIDIYNPFSKKIVKKYMKEIKPEIVICHNIYGWSPSIWLSVYKKGIPLIQFLHDQYLLCPINMFKNNIVCQNRCITCSIMRYPHKVLSNKVTAVVGCSQFILNKLLSYGYFKTTLIKRVIYNSRKIDTGSGTPRKLNKNIHIGFIGSIEPNKGIEVLLRAFSRIETPNIWLFIAGSGNLNYVNYLKKKYKNSNLLWEGWTKPEEFFKKIDFLVVPSIWEESFGIVIIESFAFGIPVIGSRIGGTPEIIEENLNGLLFEPGNYEELAEKILKMSGNIIEWKKKYKVIQKSAAKFLDYNSWINEWEELINEVR
ncbi:MAG: glycosyltransferase family 4 protein [Bacteroidales bacterium]|nr:glycosyltransferase family 4 protein [Bacteroidales bacterium]